MLLQYSDCKSTCSNVLGRFSTALVVWQQLQSFTMRSAQLLSFVPQKSLEVWRSRQGVMYPAFAAAEFLCKRCRRTFFPHTSVIPAKFLKIVGKQLQRSQHPCILAPLQRSQSSRIENVSL